MTTHEESQPLTEAAQPMARRDFLKKAAALGGTALAFTQVKLPALAAGPDGRARITPPSKDKAGAAAGALPAHHPKHGYNADEQIQPMTFPNLASVEGISQNQLNQHLTLYTGYVKKINDIQAQIRAAHPDPEAMNPTYSPFRELHVEQTYALNGVILHEYYFENLGGGHHAPTEAEMVYELFSKEFGGWDNYISHLMALGKSMRGWVITGYNMRDHRIHNYGLDLHNQWTPVHVMPLLVLDVYEHAYMIDFGVKRAPYLEAFSRNINWAVVNQRLKTMILHG